MTTPISKLAPGQRFRAELGNVYEGQLVRCDASAATVKVRVVGKNYVRSFVTGDGEPVQFDTGWEQFQWSCGTRVTPLQETDPGE